MSGFSKIVTRIGLISLFSVMPLAAQLQTSLRFTAPFTFYVGDNRMPSGSYIITRPSTSNFNLVSISSSDGSNRAAIVVIPTESIERPKQSKIIFERHGGNLYLDRVVINGSTEGVLAEPTRAEKKAEEHASIAEEQSVTVSGQ